MGDRVSHCSGLLFNVVVFQKVVHVLGEEGVDGRTEIQRDKIVW